MARSNTEGRIMGRPSVVTPEVIDKLRQAYLIGATNDEAAHYAGIAPSTLYLYMEKNPEFSEQINAWKNEPILKAKRKVVTDLDSDTNTAKWYLERKAKDFKPKTEVDVNVPVALVEFVGEGDDTNDIEPAEG